MDAYEVVAVGGGIAGSVAARLAAARGLKTLLIERRKTPRVKSCSGIQFPYLEKLLGTRIPPDKLCRNALTRVEIVTPQGQTLQAPMKMLNFWRATLDSWLNGLAADAGADFHDEARLIGFQPDDAGFALRIQTPRQTWLVHTRYLVAADGLYSHVRKTLRPGDFARQAPGATVNYYVVGQAGLDPHTLYMVYNRDFSTQMFAWAYLKDDQWVVGAGGEGQPLLYAERFLRYIQETYGLDGQIVKREGFASTLVGGVYLGQGNLLLTGDAAGLVDAYRGLGMDNAALSARLAVQAILAAGQTGRPAIDDYQRRMRPVVRRLQANARKQAARYASNDRLEASLAPAAMLKGGLLMKLAGPLNRFLPPERLILLPL